MKNSKISVILDTCPWCGEYMSIPTKLTGSCPDTIVRLGKQCRVCGKSPVALICNGKVEVLDTDGAYTSEGSDGELIEGDLGPEHELDVAYLGYNDIERLPIKMGDTVTIPKGTPIRTTSPRRKIIAGRDYPIVVADVDPGCDHPGHFCNPEIVWVGRGGYWYYADINYLNIQIEKPCETCSISGSGINKGPRHRVSRKNAGKHDWSGAWLPDGRSNTSNVSFSVGIFKWVPSKNGLKKSKVIFRVKGFCRDADKVYRLAEDICKKLDNGEVLKGKSVTVR